jgi:hypothetical protein
MRCARKTKPTARCGGGLSMWIRWRSDRRPAERRQSLLPLPLPFPFPLPLFLPLPWCSS